MPDVTQQGDWVPRPDPTVLTTAQLLREMTVLRDLMEVRLDAAEGLNIQRYGDLKELMLTGQSAAKEAVQAALTSAKEAVYKAENASDKRFEGVNEFRKTLSDQASSFLPRAEYNTAYKALIDRLDITTERVAALELRLTSRLDRGEGADHGVREQKTLANASMILITQVVIGLIAIASLIIAIVVHVH